jgi:hypothetical protein
VDAEGRGTTGLAWGRLGAPRGSNGQRRRLDEGFGRNFSGANQRLEQVEILLRLVCLFTGHRYGPRRHSLTLVHRTCERCGRIRHV